MPTATARIWKTVEGKSFVVSSCLYMFQPKPHLGKRFLCQLCDQSWNPLRIYSLELLISLGLVICVLLRCQLFGVVKTCSCPFACLLPLLPWALRSLNHRKLKSKMQPL